MSWWLGYGATRAFGDLVRGELSSERRDGDYLLPDEQARQAAVALLAQDSELSESKLEVVVLSGVLTLEGAVSAAELKERAGWLCAGLRHVERVDNRLRVG